MKVIVPLWIVGHKIRVTEVTAHVMTGISGNLA